MKTNFKKLIILTLDTGVLAVLTGCSGGCRTYRDAPHHKHYEQHRGAPQSQDIIMYESSETIIAEVVDTNIMRAQMYTRSSRGGTSEMGYIKFANGQNGTKMIVDLADLRPNKDYTVKIYQCGNCSDYTCCKSKCMNVKLPILSINEPGRLSKTYNVSGLNWNNLSNAKIVLTRDGEYKAAWGKLYPAM